jgi:hypothetical protein
MKKKGQSDEYASGTGVFERHKSSGNGEYRCKKRAERPSVNFQNRRTD